MREKKKVEKRNGGVDGIDKRENIIWWNPCEF